MIRQFEKFTDGPWVSSVTRPHVTLNSRGQLVFNRMVNKMLGSPRAVVFYFDKATSVIGISSAQPMLTEAFPVISKQTHFYVNAITFSRHYGIHIEGTEAFLDPELDEKGILHLDLRRTRTVYGGKRKKKSQ